jgi:decaprenylphospho-beta-D-ribofuranose 2-oxidase
MNVLQEKGLAPAPTLPDRVPLPDFMAWEDTRPLVGTRPSRSLVAYGDCAERIRETLAFCRDHGLTICLRGSGHSYGDLVQNDGQVVLDTTRMNRLLGFDEVQGRLRVEPGVRVVDVYRIAHPLLFNLPAAPSEGTITIAGAIANNVNGKDGWKAGHFVDRVIDLVLITADGTRMRVDREAEPDLFRVVVGGMGLFGIIVEATIQLEKVPSPLVEITRINTPDMDRLLEAMEEVKRSSDFAIAWLDVYAGKTHTGRGVVHAARWLPWTGPPEQVGEEVAQALDELERRRIQAQVFHGVLQYILTALLHLQRITVRGFNLAYYVYCGLRSRLFPRKEVEPFVQYNFFPNFKIPPASMLCGPWGFTVQILIPEPQAHAGMSELLELCRHFPCPAVTVVLRLHRDDEQTLSFSGDGYSLNFEFHLKKRHRAPMADCLEQLMACAAHYGAKVYLAKDMTLKREQFMRLYPDAEREQFMRMKRRWDPEGRFASDLYRRLLARSPGSSPVKR